jgi:hypothetical protein
MRQVALCVILAQAGCFVPATEKRACFWKRMPFFQGLTLFLVDF